MKNVCNQTGDGPHLLYMDKKYNGTPWELNLFGYQQTTWEWANDGICILWWTTLWVKLPEAQSFHVQLKREKATKIFSQSYYRLNSVTPSVEKPQITVSVSASKPLQHNPIIPPVWTVKDFSLSLIPGLICNLLLRTRKQIQSDWQFSDLVGVVN